MQPQVVEEVLNRVLASKAFSRGERLRRFLEYAVREQLAGNGGRLKEYQIGVAVFDRGANFDPQIDNIVRVEAIKLRERLASYFQTDGAAEPVRISFPKGCYRPTFQRRDEQLPVMERLAKRHALPVAPTPFIGRERERAIARDLLLRPSTRLLTLSGPGGVGKTRLSLQVAADTLAAFRDGVCLVELAPVPATELVLPTLAKAFGLRETPNRPLFESVQEYLSEKQLLLVLDNFEHLMAAASGVAELLANCLEVKALVTSREVLHLSGEQQLCVPPLSLPAMSCPQSFEEILNYEAIQLFIDRAKSVKPGFKVSATNAGPVAEICHRLDGLPLAIELAAARVNVLSPAGLLGRLGQRMAVLTGGPRDAPLRHQTLRQAIAWSHELLSAEEQRLFRRLAVFAGGCTLAAAEFVAGPAGEGDGPADDVLTGLSSLIDKSLLRQDEMGAEEEPRFTMLETLREFALERLSEANETHRSRARHAGWYVELAQEAEPGLTGQHQDVWLERLQQEYDNLRAALQWLVNHGPAEHGLRLATALSRFWRAHGYIAEVRQALSNLLAAQCSACSRAKALRASGWLAREQGDYAEARTLFDESISIYRTLQDPRGIGWSLVSLAFVARYQGDYAQASMLLEESLPLLRQAGDLEGMAVALGNLGLIARDRGDASVAEKQLQASLELWLQLGDPIGQGWVLTALGIAARCGGQRELARSRLDQALAVWRKIGDRQNQANALGTLASLARDAGEFDAAARLLRESLSILREIGDRRAIAFVLEGFSSLAAARDQAMRAVALWAAAQALRERIGAPAPPAWHAELDRTLNVIKARLEVTAVDEASRRGRSMTLPDAIAFALDLTLNDRNR
jgi:predicted ATPase